MRFRTSIITVVVTVALALPAAALSAKPVHRYAPVVVTTFYPGTTAISAGCTMTLVAGHVSSTRCPGTTPAAKPGNCTLTVAAGHLWTYDCPSGASGASTGAIPSSCTEFLDAGYLWSFSCPKSAFGDAGPTRPAATKRQPVLGANHCSKPLTDDYLVWRRCSL
jgi:hypothetical protein